MRRPPSRRRWLLRWAGVPAVVSTRHGLVAPPYPLRRELAFWLAARCCGRVVAVCNAARNNLASGCGAVADKIVTIFNGADPAPAGPSGCAPIVRQGFTLVHVSRLAWYKDQGTLLRAVALARRQVPDLRLWVIGDGPEAAALRALAQALGLAGAVDFLGEREDVGRWLSAADVFVLSSLTEGLPVSLLEAMAAGLPAIATGVGGVAEVLRLSGAGRTAPPGRPDLLAEAIIDYAHRRRELPALGQRARQCYQAHFTCERMTGEYLELYEACRKQRGSQAAAAQADAAGFQEERTGHGPRPAGMQVGI